MPNMRNGGMAMQAERGRGLGSKGGSDAPKKKVDFKKLWPTIWTLVKPRRWLIALGFVLVAIKTVSGLTLPYLSKYLLDNVLASAHPQPQMLPKLIAIVVVATTIQAIVSFALTSCFRRKARSLSPSCASRCSSTLADSPSPITTPRALARSSRAS
jgi:ABC-type bacteriocin/lantibiotic exporter with double-glycine peptidase domain